MTNPIDPAAAAALTAPAVDLQAATPEAEPMAAAPQAGLATRTRAAGEARARRVASAVLDRVGARTAVIVGDDVAGLRREIARLDDDLARTRAELTAEIELLRAELASVTRGDDAGQG